MARGGSESSEGGHFPNSPLAPGRGTVNWKIPGSIFGCCGRCRLPHWMVEQTQMTEHNGHNGKSSSPLVTAARDVRQVAHDVVELAELQAIMARVELQGWWKQFVVPIVLVMIAAVIAA